MTIITIQDDIGFREIDLAEMTRDELLALKQEILQEIDAIKGQLEMADARKAELGEEYDRIWYAKAKCALRYKTRTHEAICACLSKTSPRNRDFNSFFYENAKRTLSESVFSEIHDRAHDQHQEYKETI